MKTVKINKNKKRRVTSVNKPRFLKPKLEKRFDRITQIATEIFNVPISTITLIDSKGEFVKSYKGISKREIDRTASFYKYALVSKGVFVVQDAKKDKRFSNSSVVTGKPYISFYAGAPIIDTDGKRLGVFCIKDSKPRKFSTENKKLLNDLALWVNSEVNAGKLKTTLLKKKKLQAKLIQDYNTAQELRVKDEAILASIGEGLMVVDNERKVIVINKVATDMIGWGDESFWKGNEITNVPLVGQNGEPIPLEKRPTTLALKTGKTAKVVYNLIRKDKTSFPIAITATPVKLNGKTIGLVEIIRDITIEKQIDRAKTEFVSLASHQLRTPLTAISWYTEMILRGDLGQVVPDQKEFLEKIYQANVGMIELVNTLLDVSRIELGKFKYEPKLIDIVALLEGVLDEQRVKIEAKNISVSKNFTKDINNFFTDPKLIHIVFQNLLANAISYTPSGGKINIDMSLDVEKALYIKISDTGYGIPRNQQDQIFTKLFRADNIKDKNAEGTGLGLYIVKSTIESMKGKIWFESEENKGTTFYVTLP